MVDTTKWDTSGGLLPSCTKGKTDQKESFNLAKNSFIYHPVTSKVLACDKHAFKIPLVIHRELEPWKL